MLKIKWTKCGDDGHWCNLKTLNLDNNTTKGI